MSNEDLALRLQYSPLFVDLKVYPGPRSLIFVFCILIRYPLNSHVHLPTPDAGLHLKKNKPDRCRWFS